MDVTSARLKEVADRNPMKFNRGKSKVLYLKEESQSKIGWGSALQDWLLIDRKQNMSQRCIL